MPWSALLVSRRPGLVSGPGGGSPSPGTGTPLPTAARTVPVGSSAALAAALAAAIPGDHIVIADGSYATIDITRGGTPEAPVVVMAANILGATMPRVEVNAKNVILYGVDVVGSVSVGYSAPADSFALWRCRVRNGSGFGVRLYTCPDFDGAYTQVGPWQGRGFGFHATNAPRPVWRRSIFRDADPTGDNDGEAMHYSFGPGDVYASGLVTQCKFKNWNGEGELVSIKCGNNRLSQVTVENCAGSIDVRIGRNNTFESVWCNGSWGIGVHDGCIGTGNRLLGCKVENVVGGSSNGIMIRAGNLPVCGAINGPNNSAAGYTKVHGCEGQMIVGRTYSNSSEAAGFTEIRQHTGSIDLSRTLPVGGGPSHVNTDNQPGVSSGLSWPPLLWLDDNMVGPFADL